MTPLPARAGTVWALIVVLAGIGAGSCAAEPDTDLSGKIDGVMLARQRPSATVDEIVGGFDIYLELGAQAPAAVDVAPNTGSFVLVRESDQKALTDLKVDCLTTRHLVPGDKASVHVTVAQEGVAQTLPTALMDQICQAGWLRIDAIIPDTPGGTPNTPLRSVSFELINCQ